MPQRIQRKRTKGWRMPEGAVYVGRPSPFANPFPIRGWVSRDDADRWPHIARLIPGGPQAFGVPFNQVRITSAEMAVAAFFDYVIERPALTLAVRDELHGKDLACWCSPDSPCHADVLLELAN